jgi:hypothetical protein
MTMNQVVRIKELDPSDYDWSPSFEQPFDTGPTGPLVVPVQTMPAWSVEPDFISDASNVQRRPAIKLICLADMEDVSRIWVRVRVKETARVVLDTADLPYETPWFWRLSGDWCLPDETYEVQARVVPFGPRETEFSGWITVKVGNIQLTSADLKDHLITSDKVLDGAIIAGKIANAAISANAIMDAAVTSLKIADQAVSTAKIAVAAVTAEVLANNAVIASKLADAAVQGRALAQEAVDATKFAQGIQPLGVIDGTVVPATKTLETVVVNGKLYRWENGAYTATVQTVDLVGQVVGTQISDAAITAAKMADAAITASKFASGIRPIEIVAELPTTGNFIGRTVFLTTDEKQYRYTTSGFTAVINASDIAGEISEANIAGFAASKITGQLTDAQIAAVSAAKLSGQVAATQIADLAITNAKLAALAVDASKLANNAVTNTKIADDAISTQKLQANAVVADKIAANSISAKQLILGDFENFIPDGQFEQANTPELWSMSVPWNGFASLGTNPSIWLWTGDSQTGKYSLVLDNGTIGGNNASIHMELKTFIPVTAGDWLAGDVSVRTSDGTSAAGFYYRLNWFDRNKEPLTNPQYTDLQENAPIPAAWAKMSQKTQVPGAATYAQVQIYHHSTSSTRYLIIDRISLRKAEGAELVVDGTISTVHLGADSITTEKIAAGAVTAQEIAAESITTAKLRAGAVEAANIAAGAITAGKIAAGAVTAGTLAAGAVTAGTIAANAITAGTIAAGAVSADQIAANAITSAKINAGAISADKLSVGTGANNIENGDATAGTSGWAMQGSGGHTFTIGDPATNAWTLSTNPTFILYQPNNNGSLYINLVPINKEDGSQKKFPVTPGQRYEVSAYTGAHRCSVFVMMTFYTSAGAIISEHVAQVQNTGQRVGGKTLNDFLRSYLIMDAPVNAASVLAYVRKQATISGQADSVAFITDVFFAKAKPNQTEPSDYSSAGVTVIGSGNIMTNAVVADKISASAVTAGKIAANAVTAGTIAANAVTSDTIAANAITAGKIAVGAVNADQIVANAISSSKIAAGSIVADKLAVGKGSNWIPNSNAGAGITNWAFYASTTGWTLSERVDTFAPIGGCFQMLQSGARQNGSYADLSPMKPENITDVMTWPVAQGSWVEASVYVFGHRSDYARLHIQFNNAAGAVLGYAYADKPTHQNFDPGSQLSNYERIWVKGQAPTGTTHVNVFLRCLGHSATYGVDSYTWISKFYLGEATVNQTEPSPWVEGGTTLISGGNVVTNAITAEKIAAGAIIAGKIAAGAVTATTIAADSITGDKIYAATISGDKMAANTIGAREIAAQVITAKHLVLTDFNNLVPDNQMTTMDAWSNTAGWDIWGDHGLFQSYNAVRFFGGPFGSGGYTSTKGKSFPVKANTPYRFTGQVYSNDNYGAIIRVLWINASGGIAGTADPLTTGNRGAGGSGLITANLISPASAVSCIIELFVNRDATGGVVYFGGVGMFERNGGELIVDGAITTGLLAANSVTSDKIVSNSITAVKIAANAVTADKINVSSLNALDITVVNADIQNLTIGGEKIANGAISNVYYNTSGAFVNKSQNTFILSRTITCQPQERLVINAFWNLRGSMTNVQNEVFYAGDVWLRVNNNVLDVIKVTGPAIDTYGCSNQSISGSFTNGSDAQDVLIELVFLMGNGGAMRTNNKNMNYFGTSAGMSNDGTSWTITRLKK